MSMRVMILVPFVLAATATACMTDELPTGTVGEEIAWGSSDTGVDDAEQRKRDVVVHLEWSEIANGRRDYYDCSGTLVTPRLVITSSDCLRGVENDPWFRPHADRPGVGIGELAYQSIAYVQADGVLPYIDRVVNLDTASRYEVATDVAIVYLPPSIGFAERAISTRPSFESSEHDGAQIAGYAIENLDHDRRQVGSVPYDRIDTHDTRYFETYGAAARAEDAGGALFRTRYDGTRDVIGVLVPDPDYRTHDIHTSRAADLTSDLMANWIRSNVQDDTRTDEWYRRHGVEKGNYWLGEVDYTGPCRYIDDIDCDHWMNDHDNCPYTSNIDQRDSEGSELGDACERPLVVPSGCVVTNHCDRWVDSQCTGGTSAMAIDSRGPASGGAWVPGARVGGDWEYRVCDHSGDDKACDKPRRAVFDKAACGCPVDACSTIGACALPDGQLLAPPDDDPDFDGSCKNAGGVIAPMTTCRCT
jgi:hypothetical protein